MKAQVHTVDAKVLFITNFHEVPVFGAKMRVDDVFSVVVCSVTQTLKTDFGCSF